MKKEDVKHLRRSYEKESLDIAEADASPIRQFSKWFNAAMQLGEFEANAMLLSTATPDGKPSARMMLMKEFGEHGFVFFTNYESRKGREIANNPKACITFWWAPLEKQVRIEGVLQKMADSESEAYFKSRPQGSQAGAIASPQSTVIPSRLWLEERFAETEKQKDLQRPPHWGGFILEPEVMEFWQGRPNRLHDRLRYTRTEDNNWKIERLAP
ncbi:MAG: pyridoxamine 5'-phosphate oxidase [Chitinophagales bacterium]